MDTSNSILSKPGKKWTAAELREAFHKAAQKDGASHLVRAFFGPSEAFPKDRVYDGETPRVTLMRKHMLDAVCGIVDDTMQRASSLLCELAMRELGSALRTVGNSDTSATGRKQIPCLMLHGMSNRAELTSLVSKLEYSVQEEITPLASRLTPTDGTTAAEIVHALILRLLSRDARIRSNLSSGAPEQVPAGQPASPTDGAHASASPREEGGTAAGQLSAHLNETQLINVTFTALCDRFIGESITGGADGEEGGGDRVDVDVPVAAPGTILRNWYAAYLAEVHDEAEHAPPLIVVIDDVASFPPALFDSVLSMLGQACTGTAQAPAVPLLLVCGCSTTKNAVQALHGNVLRHLLLRELYLPAITSVRRAVMDDLLVNGHFPLLLPGTIHDLLDAHLSAYQEGLYQTADMLKGAMALHCNRSPVGHLRSGQEVMTLENAGYKASSSGKVETTAPRPPGRPRKETGKEPPRLDPRDVPYPPSLWFAPLPAQASSSASSSATAAHSTSTVLTPRLAMHCMPLADWAAGFAKQGLSMKQLEDRAALAATLSSSLSTNDGLAWPAVAAALPWLSPLYNLSMRVAAWIPEAEVNYLIGELPSLAGKHDPVVLWAEKHWLPLPAESGQMPTNLPQATDEGTLLAELTVPAVEEHASQPGSKRGKASRGSAAGKGGRAKESAPAQAPAAPVPDKKLSKLLRDHEVWFMGKRSTVRGGVSDDDPAVTGIPACDAPIGRDPGTQAWAPLSPYPWTTLVESLGEDYALVQQRALLAVCHYRWACWRLGFRAVAACITSVACKDACSPPTGQAGASSGATAGAVDGRMLSISNKSLRTLHAECMGDSPADELARSTRRTELHRVILTLTRSELRHTVMNVVHTLSYGGGPTAALGAGTVPGIPSDSLEADPLSDEGLPAWSRAAHPAVVFLPHLITGRDLLHRLVHDPQSFDKMQQAVQSVAKSTMVIGVAKSAEKKRQDALAAALSQDKSTDPSADSRSLQGAREAVSQWLAELAQAFLCSPSTLPMHEAFLFRHLKDWEEVHCADHRQSLFTALTTPWTLPYSGLPAPTDPEAITPDLPDLTVAFRTLSVQRGRVVHLGVWYAEWRDVYLPHLSSDDNSHAAGAGGKKAGRKPKGAAAYADTDRSMMTASAVEDILGEEAMDAPGAAYDLGATLEGQGSAAYAGSAAILRSPARPKAKKSKASELTSAVDTAENEEELEALLENGGAGAGAGAPAAATGASEAVYAALQGGNEEGGGVEGATAGVKRKRGRPKGSTNAARAASRSGQPVSKEEQGIVDRFWAAVLQLDKQGVIKLFRRGGSDFAEKKLYDVVSF